MKNTLKARFKIFIYLFITFGVSIPIITIACSKPNIEVLSVKVIQYSDEPCDNWKLNPTDIESFFVTSKEFVGDMQFAGAMNSFDFLGCRVEGLLIANDIEWEYELDLGGYARWRKLDNNNIQREFGCSKGSCLKYIQY